jgi:phosphinothricin acetyltransferase
VDIVFEPLEAGHGPAVMAIFNHYIENGFSAYPERRLPGEFFGRFLDMTRGYPAFAIKEQGSGQVVGFCFLHAYHPMPAFKATAEITYFIAPQATGMGIGSSALDLLENEARKMGVRVILASISSLNEGSVAFHRRHGFCECGRFRGIGRKLGRDFDMVWMQKDLV